jgi:alpha-glucosidase (family GH31 glycosyl hydrolase)
VKFPTGDIPWINYWTGEQIDAGTTSATVDAPLDHVPLFIKAGSIIPMGPDLHYVDEKPADPLTLDIYPYANSAYTLYEDDGATTDYQIGKFAATKFSCGSSPDGCTVIIGPSTGDYTGKPASRTYILQVHSPHTFLIHRDKAELAQQNSRDAFDAAAQGAFSDGKIIWVKFQTPTDKSVSIVITNTN